MLLSAQQLLNIPVMSLQTGGQLARVASLVIDPRNLTIIAFELDGPALDIRPSFLCLPDVRELSNMGLIVDSSDEFVGLDDVIKVKEVYEFKFTLDDKTVVDEKGRRLGKVTGFSVEPNSFLVKQLNVKRPLLKSLTDTELLIDRTQVVEVSDDKITVKNDEREPAAAKSTAHAYANPFRGTTPQPEAIDQGPR